MIIGLRFGICEMPFHSPLIQTLSFSWITERRDSKLQQEISKEIKKRKGKELPRLKYRYSILIVQVPMK